MNWGWKLDVTAAFMPGLFFSMTSASAGGRLRPAGAGRHVTAGALIDVP
jgi:hypothetical protein